MNVMSLPPKMAAEYAERAKRGEATEELGSGIFVFRRPNDRNEVVIMSLNPPQGHIKRMSHAEMTASTAALTTSQRAEK